MYTTEIPNAMSPTSWFYNLYILSQNKTDSNLPPKMEVDFPLDSSASLSVPFTPCSMMISQLFNVCNHDPHVTSKTLTIANQSEAPVNQLISVTCLSSKGTKSRQFMITFTVADVKYNMLGTPFFEKTHKKLISNFLP